MATKRKTKTGVTYEAQWHNGREWRSDLRNGDFKGRLKALQYARTEAQRCAGLKHRIVRVERTVVAEVRP